MITKVIAFALCAFFLLAALPSAATEPPAGWLVVSDIHFDPFADPRIAEKLLVAPGERWRAIFAAAGPQAVSGYGSDTNYALLESTLEAMRNAEEDPPVIVLTGDFLAHHFRAKFDKALPGRDEATYDAFVDNTIRFLAAEFRAAYPHTQFVATIGNNDTYCDDYQMAPNSPFFANFSAAWGIPAAPNGYYTVKLPGKDLTAIVLNDVFFAAKDTNACVLKNANPAADELAWINSTLASLSGKNAWLVMHVPPGVDTFSSLAASAGSAPVMFLAPRWNDALIATLGNTSANIVAAFSAHTHMNGYRLIGADPTRPRIGMLLNPSVSPVYANNPTFTMIRVGADGVVQNAAYYTLQDLSALAKDAHRMAAWRREYDFNAAYGKGAIDAAHLEALQHAIFDNQKTRRRFGQYYDGGSGRAPITDDTWRAYWCSNVALTATSYLACAAPQIQPIKR
jgi:sphingomyelin phosphodiesterase acid-like 3